MLSVRVVARSLQRVPVPAVILLFICGIFVVSQYPASSLQDASSGSRSTFVILDGLSKQKQESLVQGDGTEIYTGTGSEELRQNERPPRWTYSCVDNTCKRREADEKEVINSIDVCWLTCGSHGSTWPFPKFQRRGPDTIKFLPGNVHLARVEAASAEVEKLLREAYEIKQKFWENYPGLVVRSNSKFSFLWPFRNDAENFTPSNNVIQISLAANSTEESITLSTDESYEIGIDEDKTVTSGIHLSVFIFGKTFFGVRHGLELLSQLIALDASGDCLQILRKYYAKDGPKFPYRGILIDSARNFVPISVLKRIITGMSYNKLNMLHLHLTDSNSFTFYSTRVPQMTHYGALSEKQIYYPNELRDLVRYAKVHGVKIIPEVDTPSHAGNGWQFGKKLDMGDLAFYTNMYDDSWKGVCGQPPCGILNPVNIHVYEVLERIYTDMLEVFDKDIFHMGGDEVTVESWLKQPELKKWVNEHRSYGIGLWKFFQAQAFERLRKHSENVTAILWTSSLTAEEANKSFLDTSKYIIQVWEPSNSKQLQDLLNKGFSVIISFYDKFYLDWGEGTWLGTEHNWPYHNWQIFYDTPIGVRQTRQILGGEAPLWSEKTGQWQVEVKLWPRAAAFAENLWSSPQRRSAEVYSRLNYQNYRMQQREIPTGMLQPESCLMFNGHCRNPRDMI